MSDQIEGIYAFIVIEPDGTEGIVGMAVEGLSGPLPMVTSRVHLLAKMDPIAASHAKRHNHRVELRYFPGPYQVLRSWG